MGDRGGRKRFPSERGSDGGTKKKKKSFGASSSSSVHFLTHTAEYRSKIMGAEYMIPGAGRSMSIDVQQLLPSHLLTNSLTQSSLSERMEAWKRYRMQGSDILVQSHRQYDQQQYQQESSSKYSPVLIQNDDPAITVASPSATATENSEPSIEHDDGMTLIEKDVVRQCKHFINTTNKISDIACLSTADTRSIQECLFRRLKSYSTYLLEYVMTTINNKDKSHFEILESERKLALQSEMAKIYQRTILPRGINNAHSTTSKQSSCFFLVGPNGCGKTSILNSIFEPSQMTLWHAGLLDNVCTPASVEDSISTMLASCTSVLINSSKRHIWRPVIIKDIDSIMSLPHWTSSDCKLLVDFLSKLVKNLTQSISAEISKANSSCCRIPIIVFVISSTRSAYVRQLLKVLGVERETIVRIDGRGTNQSRLEWVINHPARMKNTCTKIGLSPPANDTLRSLLIPSGNDHLKRYFNDTHESLPMTSWIIHLCWQISISGITSSSSSSPSISDQTSSSSSFNMKRDLFKIMVWHNVSSSSFESRWNNILLAIPLNSLTRQIVLRSISCCLSNGDVKDDSLIPLLQHNLFISDMNFFGEVDGEHGDSIGIKSSYACSILHCWLKSSESTINPKNYYDPSGTVWLQEYSSSSSSSPFIRRAILESSNRVVLGGNDNPPPQLSQFTRSSFELECGKLPSSIDCSNTHSSDGNFNLFEIYSSTTKTVGALEPYIS